MYICHSLIQTTYDIYIIYIYIYIYIYIKHKLTEHLKPVSDFEDVLVTVAFLLRKNPRARFWTTYQERSADWSIEALLHRWSLTCVDIQLEEFGADRSELAASTLPGNHSVQMMMVTLRTEDVGL
uniref:Uncharacterized protein n=1 Tax=Seriola lalandi dorsalis TaxID=1841481 RepID=A0A3B4YH70_SERLL